MKTFVLPYRRANLIKLFFMLCFAINLSACNGSKGDSANDFCTILSDKAGDTIKPYDFVSLTYTLKTAEGKMIASTGKFDNRPQLLFRTPPIFKNDLYTALGRLSEGDSAEVKVNLASMVNKLHYNRPSTHSKYLVYQLRVNKVITRGTMNDSLLNARIEELKQQEADKAKNSEANKITNYITTLGLHPQNLPAGLRYVVMQKGGARKAQAGDILLVNYSITSLDGKVFDTNMASVAKAAGNYQPQKKYQPFETPILINNKLGFQQYAAMMAVGERALFLVPSNLAYGGNGNKLIEPYTPLRFEMQVTGFKSPKSNTKL